MKISKILKLSITALIISPAIIGCRYNEDTNLSKLSGFSPSKYNDVELLNRENILTQVVNDVELSNQKLTILNKGSELIIPRLTTLSPNKILDNPNDLANSSYVYYTAPEINIFDLECIKPNESFDIFAENIYKDRDYTKYIEYYSIKLDQSIETIDITNKYIPSNKDEDICLTINNPFINNDVNATTINALIEYKYNGVTHYIYKDVSMDGNPQINIVLSINTDIDTSLLEFRPVKVISLEKDKITQSKTNNNLKLLLIIPAIILGVPILFGIVLLIMILFGYGNLVRNIFKKKRDKNK